MNHSITTLLLQLALALALASAPEWQDQQGCVLFQEWPPLALGENEIVSVPLLSSNPMKPCFSDATDSFLLYRFTAEKVNKKSLLKFFLKP